MWSRRRRLNPLYILTKDVVYRITYVGLEPELGIKPRLLVYETSRLSLADSGLVTPDGIDPSFPGREPGVLPLDQGAVPRIGFEPISPR